MLSCFLELPVFFQVALVIFGLLGGLKIYLIATLGVCKSKNKLNGKTVIITGANTGIGKETAIDLAKRGAKVILACRDLKRAAAAKDDIITESGNKNVSIRHLDLASLNSVRKFAADVLKSEPRLDVLINNAGCAIMEKKLTEDGLEYQMQSNHFGHFLLTNLLLGLIIQSDNARIINVSSVAHKWCTELDVNDLIFDKNLSAKKILYIYGVTKMCNILFTKELARRLQSMGLLKKSAPSRIINVSSVAHAFTSTLDLNNLNFELSYDAGKVYYYSKLCQILASRHLAPLIIKDGVTVNCLHPGAVQSELMRSTPWWVKLIAEGFLSPLFFKSHESATVIIFSTGKNVTVNALHPGVVHTEFGRFMPWPAILKRIAEIFSVFFSKTSREGAQTTIHLAVADEVAGVTGEYFSDCKIVKTSKLANDMGLAKKLWETSETMVKLQPKERHF